MFEYFLQSKEIAEVQGLKRLVKKMNRFARGIDHNEELNKAIKRYSSNYKIFIDVGAATGTVTLNVASNFSKCFCFEPFLENYHKLIDNLRKSNLHNVITYNCALGQKKEICNFFVSSINHTDARFYVTKYEDFNSYSVEVDTLDNILSDKDISGNCLIKIDVQGSELEVLKGARKILMNDCIIISEFWPWGMNLAKSDPREFIDYVKSLGYTLFDLQGVTINDEYLSKLCKLGKSRKYAVEDFLIKRIPNSK